MSKEHYIAIDNAMDTNNEMTTPHLHQHICSLFPDINISKRTIARAREHLGWVHQGVKYGQLVWDANKQVKAGLG